MDKDTGGLEERANPGQRAGWCIHYRHQNNVHTEDATCEVGVRYVDFNGGSTLGMYKTMPCFLDKKTGLPDPAAKSCDKIRLPTAAEIAEHEKYMKVRINQIGAVMTAIKPWREKWKGKSHSEVIECPTCKGRLHLSISAYNGHVHGKCETPDCVSWME